MSTTSKIETEESGIKRFIAAHEVALNPRPQETEHERMTRIFGFAALNVYNVERRQDGWRVILGWPPGYRGSLQEMRSATKQLLVADGISLAEHEPVSVQEGDRYRITFKGRGGEIGLGVRHEVHGPWVLYGRDSEERYAVQ